MSRKHYTLLRTVAVAALFLTVMGCAGVRPTENYGTIVPSAEVTQKFERFELDSNLDYFISGPELYPNALIALDKTYSLEPALWKKVEFTPKTFRALITDMKNKAFLIREFPQGFAILDDNRRPIGAWYSLPGVPTWVKMAGEKTVIIPPPELGVYEKREREPSMRRQ